MWEGAQMGGFLRMLTELHRCSGILKFHTTANKMFLLVQSSQTSLTGLIIFISFCVIRGKYL